MRYHIIHTTTYTYDHPVVLAPHIVRLRPRCDVTQSLQTFSLQITPTPTQQIETIDLDGNDVVNLWFSDQSLTTLDIQVKSQVETYRSNPFAYLLEPWAAHLPMAYPAALLSQLHPYLNGSSYPTASWIDPAAVQIAQEVQYKTDNNTVGFLSELNQLIHNSCQHTIRETGDPLTPGITWNQKAGSCRDLTLLFMEACRAVGIAARFVSGYHEGDLNQSDRHLHAWAEVYLPGAGWRGYDPTDGLATSDRHIALVASPHSRYAAPISGTLKTYAPSQLSYHIGIQLID